MFHVKHRACLSDACVSLQDQVEMFHVKRLGWLDYGDARNLFSAPTHEQSLPD